MTTAPPGNRTLFDIARHYMATAAAAVVPERPIHRFPHFVRSRSDCMHYSSIVLGEGWSVTAHVHLQQRYVYAIAETDAEPGIGYVVTSRDVSVHRVDLETGEVLGDAECAAAVDVPELEAVA